MKRSWSQGFKRFVRIYSILVTILMLAFAGLAVYYISQTLTLRELLQTPQTDTVNLETSVVPTRQDNTSAEKTAQPVSEAVQRAFTVGEHVFIGVYSQNSESAHDPIEWLVLENDGQYALLLSTRVLDVQPYDQDGQTTAWTNSSLRTWLNSTFLDKAFTSAEKAGLVAGLGETDQRFPLSLLGEAELNTLLPEQSSRIAMASQWAENSRGAEIKKEWLFNSTHQAIWWLRTADENHALAVNADGAVTSFDATRGGVGVRPCCRMDLRSAAAETAAQMMDK